MWRAYAEPKKDRALVKGQHGVSEPLGMKRAHPQETSQLRVSESRRACRWQLGLECLHRQGTKCNLTGSSQNGGHVQMSEVNDSSDTAGQQPRMGVTETKMPALDAGHQ